MIGAFRSCDCFIAPRVAVPSAVRCCSPAVVYSDRGHPCFRNFISTIPVDVNSVKSSVDSFLHPAYVPVRISINKLYIVPNRIVGGLVSAFRNSTGLAMGKSYIPVVFFDPFLHRSPCFSDVNFPALPGKPVEKTILFSQVDRVLWPH